MGRLKGRGLPSRLGAQRARLQEHEARRSPGWYSSPEWRRLKREFYRRCGGVCQQTGVLLVGRYPAGNSPVLDHIEPHRGNREMFFDEENLQLVSKEWHDRVKQGREKRGEA